MKLFKKKIVLSGRAKDGKEKSVFSASTVRYNFEGGKYGTMKSYDGHRHHMPSNSVSSLSTYLGPCIRMIKEEHKLTASYGGTKAAKEFRKKEKKKINKGEFLAAQQLSINDIQNKFGMKYNAAINEMSIYTTNILGYKK